ncbi:hypothetical protein BS78_04G271900 [Paspalum vaginatum]|nr:hypothetical protein BS78_04G271900 [Paspalum vaginatum]
MARRACAYLQLLVIACCFLRRAAAAAQPQAPNRIWTRRSSSFGSSGNSPHGGETVGDRRAMPLAVRGVRPDTTGRVTRLALSRSNLTGPVPDAIGSLLRLIHLELPLRVATGA